MEQFPLDSVEEKKAEEPKPEIKKEVGPIENLPSLDPKLTEEENEDTKNDEEETAEPEVTPKEEEKQEQKEIETKEEDMKEKAEGFQQNKQKAFTHGFFSHLKEKFTNHNSSNNKIDSKKVLENMRVFHESKKEREELLEQKTKMDAEVNQKMWELEMLEEGWYFLRKEIETKHKLLDQKEMLIEKSIAELSELMQKAKVFSKYELPHDKSFVFSNGTRISSIDELKETLKRIDNHIFSNHVNENRNDFSSWIRNVFQDGVLADKILTATTKEELIEVLEKI